MKNFSKIFSLKIVKKNAKKIPFSNFQLPLRKRKSKTLQYCQEKNSPSIFRGFSVAENSAHSIQKHLKNGLCVQ